VHPEIARLLAQEHQAELRRTAAWSSQVERAGAAHAARGRAADAPVSLRLDRVSDADALERLAGLCTRRLPPGPFVVGEVEGRVVAALPVHGGAPLADPFVPTKHLLPLLELRAAQIRGADEVRPRGRRRLLPRRA